MNLLNNIKEINEKKYSFGIKTIILKYILLFFICSFIGWVYEELLFIFPNFIFVKRGFLYGPYLPIYGWGSILMVLLLKKYKEDPKKFFILAMIISGILEYGTGEIMFIIWHRSWWDYSGYLLNIGGYVSLVSIVAFGLCGLVLIYIIEPYLNVFLEKQKCHKLQLYVIILVILYIVDNVLSFKFINL